jgi:hypothetical protein
MSPVVTGMPVQKIFLHHYSTDYFNISILHMRVRTLNLEDYIKIGNNIT